MRLFLIFFILISHSGISQKTCQIILVRHAEKASDDPSDPNLNSLGLRRSEKLFRLLEKQKITAVYSTDYKRTKETVVSIANANQLEVSIYSSLSESFWNKIISKNLGKTIVVSGHSNTTPLLVNLLIGENKFEQLADSEYGNIYIVNATKVGNGTVLLLRY